MEFLRDLFATAVFALFFSFAIGKLVSFVTTANSQSLSNNIDSDIVPDVNDKHEEDVIMEELQFHQKFQVENSAIQNITDSVDSVTQKIDEFGEKPIEEEVKKEVEEIVMETGRKNDVVEEVMIESDEDWEGIERSELEKVFAEAVKLAESEEKLTTNLELYGLNKVVMEGPCREQPPMPLKLSARAKCDGGQWFHCARNAWQKLGNLSPETAMEQYIAIVSDTLPAWMEHKSTGGDNLGSSEAVDHGAVNSDICTSPPSETEVINERDAELKTADKELM